MISGRGSTVCRCMLALIFMCYLQCADCACDGSCVSCDNGVCCDNSAAIDAAWTTWVTGTCSVTCGVGTRPRTRTCEAGACGGNTLCDTASISTIQTLSDTCDTNRCCAQAGVWSYGPWSAWSAYCGSRSRVRLRGTCNATCFGTCPSPILAQSEIAACAADPTLTGLEVGVIIHLEPTDSSTWGYSNDLLTLVSEKVNDLIGSKFSVSAKFDAFIGDLASTSLHFELQVSAETNQQLTTQCDLYCAVKSVVQADNFISSVKSIDPRLVADAASLDADTNPDNLRTTCDCGIFVSRSSQSVAGGGSSDDQDLLPIILSSALGGSLLIALILIFLIRRRPKRTDEETQKVCFDLCIPLTHEQKRPSVYSKGSVVGIQNPPRDLSETSLVNAPLEPLRDNFTNTIQNPLFQDEEAKDRRERTESVSKSSTVQPKGFKNYIYHGDHGSEPEYDTALTAEDAYFEGRSGNRKQSRAFWQESRQEEPPLALLQHEGTFHVFVRTSPGHYVPVKPVVRNGLMETEAVVASKVQGGYMFLHSSPNGSFKVVRTSSNEAEVMAVETLASDHVLMIQENGKYAPKKKFSRIDAAGATIVDPKALGHPEGGNTLIVVLHHNFSSGDTIETLEDLSQRAAFQFEVSRMRCTVLRQSLPNSPVFLPILPSARDSPKEIGIRLEQDGQLITLQKLKDGTYVKTASNEPRSGIIAQGMKLPGNHFQEVLTKKLQDEGGETVVTLLQQGLDEPTYSVIEMPADQKYSRVKLVNESTAMSILKKDGGYIELARQSGDPGNYTSIAPNTDLDDATPFVEIDSKPAYRGHHVALLQSEDGGYAVLLRGESGTYLRPDTGTEYVSRDTLLSGTDTPLESVSPRGSKSNLMQNKMVENVIRSGRPSVSAPEIMDQVAQMSASLPGAFHSDDDVHMLQSYPEPLMNDEVRKASRLPSAPFGLASVSEEERYVPIDEDDNFHDGFAAPVSTSRQSLGYIEVDTRRKESSVWGGRYQSTRQAPTRTPMLPSQHVFAADISPEQAQSALAARGFIEGSYVLQQEGPRAVWLHIATRQRVLVKEITLAPQLAKPFEALDDGSYLARDIASAVAALRSTPTGLPCSLTANLTPGR